MPTSFAGDKGKRIIDQARCIRVPKFASSTQETREGPNVGTSQIVCDLLIDSATADGIEGFSLVFKMTNASRPLHQPHGLACEIDGRVPSVV